MKSIIRTVLLGGLAMLALSGVATASASAAACTVKAGSKDYQLCVGGSAVEGSTTVGIESPTGGAMDLNMENVYSGLSIACEKSGLAGGYNGLQVVKTGASVKLLLRPYVQGCALTGKNKSLIESCQIPAEREFGGVFGTLESAESMSVASEGGSGSAFLEWPTSNKNGKKCDMGGTQAFIGEWECKLHEAGVEAVEHEMSCASTTRYATYYHSGELTPLSYSETIALNGSRKGEKFSIYEAS